MDAQAQDRCHRSGQTRNGLIYRLISSHTIEENILKKAMHKRRLGEMTLDEGEFTPKAATENMPSCSKAKKRSKMSLSMRNWMLAVVIWKRQCSASKTKTTSKPPKNCAKSLVRRRSRRSMASSKNCSMNLTRSSGISSCCIVMNILPRSRRDCALLRSSPRPKPTPPTKTPSTPTMMKEPSQPNPAKVRPYRRRNPPNLKQGASPLPTWSQ
uniref:Helicase C-terminal domain-containing protein n=1 Tax=Panagrellus redivivus TaxID=6233 RepID=A0A7E4VSR8_PANRE